MELFGLKPGRRIILYFAATIVIGAIVLSLPLSAARGEIRFVDALFTATSATCVTGLTVVDTAKDYTFFGQIVIMTLIQLGGLGVMTFATALLLMMRSGLSFQNRLGLSETLDSVTGTRSKHLVRAVVITTLAIETLGAGALFIRFGDEYPLGEAVFHSVFHSVSAFCNAGFSTFSTNLEGRSGDVWVILVISGLIICGGLGFAVITELFDRARHKKNLLSLHSKLCLTTTAALIVVGTICFFVLERNNVFRDTSIVVSAANAFFQAVTPRTAGFNTIPQAELTEISVFVTMILMFIGACPGSTGGGVKTTTFSVVALLLFNRFRGRHSVSMFRRSIDSESVFRALTVLFLGALVVGCMFTLLLSSEGPPAAHKLVRGSFVENLFETVSAFGTVGLSLGVTPTLTDLGKVFIMVTMFIGRVGLLTLAYTLARPVRRGEIVYAEQSIMVG
jgi:trk system potassium uptake protein TrkH